MADYRGGDRRTTVHGAALIKAIQEGRTERQRSRNFNQKLKVAGIQAGLQGGRALYGYLDQKDKQGIAEAKDAQDKAAAYEKAPLPTYKPMGDAAGPDADVPEWLKTGKSDAQGPKDSAMEFKPLHAGQELPPSPLPPTPLERAEAALREGAGYRAPDEDEEQKRHVTWGGGRGMMGSQ